jgi:cbb3-type cytochrome c oxidase subunit II
MKMTAAMIIIGSLLVYWASISIMIIMPHMTIHDEPSNIWIPMSKEAEKGHDLYVSNGCSYCHSLYIRINDWGHGAERIAAAGDYYGVRPAILGTERTGPDLSLEGGQRPDDWHLAHFVNPRNTIPISLMPSWEFLGKEKITALTAYMQYLGGTIARERVNRQDFWKTRSIAAYRAGNDSNIAWLHSNIAAPWRPMPNPYPATDAALERGKSVYEFYCMGCHGPVGDGNGPAAPFLNPRPLNFTLLRKHLVDGKYIGGILYYQVMNGVTGTAMPYWKRALESEKIWDVSNYIAVNYIGYTDADMQPKGIDAAYELPFTNNFDSLLNDTALLSKSREASTNEQ